MTTRDTATEQELQITDGVKIELKYAILNGDANIGCSYDGASTNMILQCIAYMLDKAYNDTDVINEVASLIPDIVKQYCIYKDAQNDIQELEESIEDIIKGMTFEELELAITDILTK